MKICYRNMFNTISIKRTTIFTDLSQVEYELTLTKMGKLSQYMHALDMSRIFAGYPFAPDIRGHFYYSLSVYPLSPLWSPPRIGSLLSP